MGVKNRCVLVLWMKVAYELDELSGIDRHLMMELLNKPMHIVLKKNNCRLQQQFVTFSLYFFSN